MAISELSRIDLNLLVALRTLMKTRSVTAAANELHVTQPAMSNTLSRLRDLFADPLFTRSPNGLVLTPKALELQEKIPPLLEQITLVLKGQSFDPLTSTASFNFAVPEPIGQALLPKLMEALQQKAPDIQIVSSEPSKENLERLARGELDFTVHLAQEFPADLVTHRLGSLRPRLLVRKNHPLTEKKRITLKSCLSYGYVYFPFYNIGDNRVGMVDPGLERMGVSRKIVFVTSHLLTALNTIKSTDYLLIMPDFLHRFPMIKENYEMLDLPSEFEFEEMDVHLVYHSRIQHSPAHKWLAELIVGLFP